MLKYVGGTCAVLFLCCAFFMIASCSEGQAGIFTDRREFIVGRDIPPAAVKDFFYTIDASTNPPFFLRYRFTQKKGKYFFYYEKREGDAWPLTEKYITASRTLELTAGQWAEFLSFIMDGRVTRRTEIASSGGSGPWLFLYWDNDGGMYQVFSFSGYERQQGFENLCRSLEKAQ